MNELKTLLLTLIAVLIGISGYQHFVPVKLGGAPTGFPAAVATSSQPTISTTAAMIAATSTGCSARVITTYASPIMLTFSQRTNTVPTAIIGHLQAASTTVAYDSGQYGCDAVTAYGFVGTTDFITETR